MVLVRQRPVNVHAPQAPCQYEDHHVLDRLPDAFLKLVMLGLNDRNDHRCKQYGHQVVFLHVSSQSNAVSTLMTGAAKFAWIGLPLGGGQTTVYHIVRRTTESRAKLMFYREFSPSFLGLV